MTRKDWILLGVLVVIGFFIIRGNLIQAKYIKQGKESHNYLCYQKTVTIPSRIQSSLDYINAVQIGERQPIPGITFSDIRTGIERDQAALRALGRVHC